MTGKVVVITGASSGIGAALTRQLASQGHQLVIAARRESELKQVAAETGSKAIPVVTDVTRREDLENLRDFALKKHGHIDVWVNNAGRGITKTVMELTDQEFDSIIDVVLKSVFYGTQTIVPHFQERGEGHLINISSFLGRVPLVSNRSIYSAAKSAVNVLTSNLRMDLKGKYPRIKVSLVLPGIVDTDFHRVAGTPMAMKAGSQVGPQTVQSASDVAIQVASLIDHPVAELYTNPALSELTRQYYANVGAFEENMTMRSSGN
ncbi:SDR family oxidoreductase [Candidatus Bathyarchaeota archaeon]|nr:MAG: SDR family oxidoreductase [Candidatus Bathyarchaeota archaeon]